ncbi:chord-domain-containing protein [Dendrothele bispora CBS 962.96]|uniref:Chord-domain-containing protein n=1 Tax=Dendrothele bispora (strain CBS 962.96) TaxID=1314807 RepID=A0A4S8MX26_DENBC|nr:chord-domain-containing protein [Dendrothele bispora CBS 962.96]
MPRCTRKGCGKDFGEGSTESCTFHPGAPVFHEGLKSWSCCSDKNKPVLDFNEFMNIPGCAETDRHSNEVPVTEQVSGSSTPNANPTKTESDTGKETYSSGVSIPKSQTLGTTLASIPTANLPPPTLVEEEDDLSVSVKPGTTCKRKGCGVTFESDEVNRNGDGEGTKCVYHPAPPIFREGSKGYLCCKRRVLEFDEFLKIEGCKVGRHLFAPKANPNQVPSVSAEELTTCRIDHYQTVDKIHVSVFAKQVDKEKSTVSFEEEKVSISLYLPASRRFVKEIDLFGPINPSASTFQILGTKVELQLQKLDTRSWTILERPQHDLGNISLTFGVTGRTGTVGAKETVLAEENKR